MKTLTLNLLLLSAVLLLSAYSYSANPVRLAIGQPFNYAVSGMTWYQSNITTHVENIGVDTSRRVYINYNLNNSGVWQRAEMSLLGNFSTHSLYSITLPSSMAEFAIEVESDMGSHWDNNEGANYKINAWAYFGEFIRGTVGGNVSLGSAESEEIVVFTKYGSPYIVDSTLRGTIFVENLSYNKDVGIVVNYGNGDWLWTSASYSHSLSTGGSDNIEVWEFEHEYYGHPYSTDWQFAVYYHNLDSNEWHWDNNFELDYFVGKTTGDSVQ